MAKSTWTAHSSTSWSRANPLYSSRPRRRSVRVVPREALRNGVKDPGVVADAHRGRRRRASKTEALRELAKENGLGGPEHTAVKSTPLLTETVKLAVGINHHIYEFYILGPAPLDLAILRLCWCPSPSARPTRRLVPRRRSRRSSLAAHVGRVRGNPQGPASGPAHPALRQARPSPGRPHARNSGRRPRGAAARARRGINGRRHNARSLTIAKVSIPS